MTFEEEKLEMLRQVDMVKDSVLFQAEIPYTFPGDMEPDAIKLQHERDRQNIQDNMIAALKEMIFGEVDKQMYFMPVSGNFKVLTPQQMLEMGDFLKQRGDAIFVSAWNKKNEVSAAVTLEELMAVDLYAGWPED